MDGYTLSISRCSGGDGVEESFKAKIKRREAALDAFAVAEAYCKESWMVSRCEREGFDGFIIDLCSDAEDETIRLVRLVPDSEDGIMDDVFRSREDGMHLRGDSVREIPFMLFLGLLFAVTVGWWVFLTLTVSVVFGNVAAAVFAVCSALSVTVGYGLVRASDSRE